MEGCGCPRTPISRVGVVLLFGGQDRPSSASAQRAEYRCTFLRSWGEQLCPRVAQKPPESGTFSLHCLGTGYSSQLHPNATDTKNSPLPPAVGQPLLHPNRMETSREWQAETLSSVLTTPCQRKEPGRAGRRAGIERALVVRQPDEQGSKGLKFREG